jgi:hypothetical protein
MAVPSFAQNLRASARRQAIEKPGEPLLFVHGPVEYVPKPVEQVASGAIAVLQAKLVRVKSYLDSTARSILTEYMITEPTVVAGHLPTVAERVPTAGKPLILTTVGGEIIVEGVTIRGENPSCDPIKEGAQYLLFLGSSRERGPNRYGIHYGAIFELSGNELKPLMKQAADILQGFDPKEHPQAFVARIQKAMQP